MRAAAGGDGGAAVAVVDAAKAENDGVDGKQADTRNAFGCSAWKAMEA